MFVQYAVHVLNSGMHSLNICVHIPGKNLSGTLLILLVVLYY
jgi:hypothetical protein